MASKKEEAHLKAYMGEEAVFNGSLSFEGTVRIDGRFEGQVTTQDTLIVGETGHLVADITAGTVVCKGKIDGTINATNRVEIHSSSQVVGTVKTPALNVEVGGVFDGQCEMTGQSSKIVKLVKNEKIEAAGSASN